MLILRLLLFKFFIICKKLIKSVVFKNLKVNKYFNINVINKKSNNKVNIKVLIYK